MARTTSARAPKSVRATKSVERPVDKQKTARQVPSDGAPDSGSDAAGGLSAFEKVNRLSRTRMRTRSKLIDAARKVMGRKGFEAATISDITEEADVGFGSFYNYFESKEEIARAVFAERAEQLAEYFASVRDTFADIALAQSVVQRLWIELARHEPLWGWFNIHAEIALQQMDETFRARIATDIRNGNEIGRYQVEAVELAATLTISTLMTTMRMVLEGRAKASAACEMSEFLLRMYGLPLNEAAELSQYPLEKLTKAMVERFRESTEKPLKV